MLVVMTTGSKIKVPYSIGIEGELAQELDSILSQLDRRSRSWLAEKLLRRGLAALKRDGLFDEPEGDQVPRLVRVQEVDVVHLDKGLTKSKKRGKVN